MTEQRNDELIKETWGTEWKKSCDPDGSVKTRVQRRKEVKGRREDTSHSLPHTDMSAETSDVIVGDVLCNTEWQETISPRPAKVCVFVFVHLFLFECISKLKCSTKHKVNPLCFAGHDSGMDIKPMSTQTQTQRQISHTDPHSMRLLGAHS